MIFRARLENGFLQGLHSQQFCFITMDQRNGALFKPVTWKMLLFPREQ